MPNVPDAPEGRQGSDLPAPLDLRDPAQLHDWLAALRTAVLDAEAAGEDATRRPKKRMFSRFEARRRLREATQNVIEMLDAAERGGRGADPA